jgi:ABC-type uncharacterized transport system substrate-binding protein
VNASIDGRVVSIASALATALLLLVLPADAPSQETDKPRRIGLLSAGKPDYEEVRGFKQGLREHGYVEGRNLIVEWRFGEGKTDRLSAFAAEFVRLKVEVIVAFNTPAALAAKKQTSDVPIVFALVPDPVGLGLVGSLARPGANLTGFSTIAADLTAKRLQLFKETIPSLKTVILLTGPLSYSVTESVVREAQRVADGLGLEARVTEVRRPGELESAFNAFGPSRGRAVFMVQSPFVAAIGDQIIELALKRQLPVMAWNRTYVPRGPGPSALMSYGPSNFDMGRRTVGHVAKILNGAQPRDLPVEEPIKFELVINRRTAKALGLTIPQSILVRADEIIQ